MVGYEVELLTHLGRLHAASGDREQAIKYLEKAATTAMQAQLNRLIAGATMELAKL